jgi:hypothetical protein
MAFYWLTWPDLRKWSWWVYVLAAISIVVVINFGINLLGLLILAPTYFRIHLLLREFKVAPNNKVLQSAAIEAKKKWAWFQKCVAMAIAIVAARYGGDMLGRWRNSRESAGEPKLMAASWQAFDEHLSLKMPN